MKKLLLIVVLGTISVLNAQDVAPAWKKYVPEQWSSKVDQLGGKAQKALLKMALGTALIFQEKKLIVLGHGGYFNYTDEGITQQCGFFPTSKSKKGLNGWAACLGSQGLNYGLAHAKCGVSRLTAKTASIGSYSFKTRANKTKKCKVYLNQ